MPEDKNGQFLQSSRSPDEGKKKRKKGKKAPTASPAEIRANPQKGESSLPETLRVSTLPPQHLGDDTPPRRKDGEDFSAGAGGGGAPGDGGVQTRESLRWEAALEDPQAEDKRLELYRANRRQRYIARRERLW